MSKPPTTDHRPLTTLVMGTRGSPLALAQSRQVAAALQAVYSGLTIEEKVIRTTGDKLPGASLPTIGGKGAFTLEIEQALLNRDIDFAVHSMKDLPPQLPDGLCIAAIPEREKAHDVCLLHSRLRRMSPQDWTAAQDKLRKELNQTLPWWDFLPYSARVGTSSLRRRAQLLHLRPDLQIEEMRGNIDTRLHKLEALGLDAIVLAYAGLNRLGYKRGLRLGERIFVSSPGQGALALEARADDEVLLKTLQVIDDPITRAQVTAERAVTRALNAGCATPFGASAFIRRKNALKGKLSLWAVVLSPDGTQRIFAEANGRNEDAEVIGQTVAMKLLEQGAQALLAGTLL